MNNVAAPFPCFLWKPTAILIALFQNMGLQTLTAKSDNRCGGPHVEKQQLAVNITAQNYYVNPIMKFTL